MKKVLIVEDDKNIALALVIRLRKAGYETFHASDAVTGTGLAAKHRPNVVLLDISMPGGNGFDVASRVQNMLGVSAAIIFITAHKNPLLRQQAEEAGAVAFFEKPYDSQQLLSAVASYC